jgi:mannose-6-phosphate isomerase-like protein (cupin superfamily)
MKGRNGMTTEPITVQQPAVVVPSGAGRALWFTTNRITIKATAGDTGGAFALWESFVPPGSSPALHVHHREEETFWVLEGKLTIRCGDETFSAGPGSMAVLPRNVPHTFVAEGDTPAHLLTLATPGGVEGYFVAAGRPAENDGLPPVEPPDLDLLQRFSSDFGLEIVGPPLAPTESG